MVPLPHISSLVRDMMGTFATYSSLARDVMGTFATHASLVRDVLVPLPHIPAWFVTYWYLCHTFQPVCDMFGTIATHSSLVCDMLGIFATHSNLVRDKLGTFATYSSLACEVLGTFATHSSLVCNMLCTFAAHSSRDVTDTDCEETIMVSGTTDDIAIYYS